MYHMNKKMEIRNVDVGYAGIMWEGRIYNSPKNTVREARLQKQNETNFCRKKLRIIKEFNTGYLTRKGERILSNSPIEKSTF